MTESTPIDQSDVIKFKQLIPGIKASLKRLPSLLLLSRKLNDLNKDSRDSIGNYLEQNAREFSENTAILYEDVKYTYKEFNEHINRYADFFLSQGLKKGDKIVVNVENRPEFLFIVCGAAKIGIISSLINTNLRSRVLLHVIKTSPGKMYIIGEEVFNAFDEIRSRLEFKGDEKICFLSDTGRMQVPEGCLDLRETVKSSNTENPTTTADVYAGDTFAYIFTSGTTGMPKAVVIPHLRLLLSLVGFGKIIMDMNTDDTLYCTLPLFHGTALGIAWPAVVANGSAFAIRRKFSVSNFWKDAVKFNATAFVYIGELCRYLMNQPESPDDIKNPMKSILGNGLRPDIWMDFKNRFGVTKVCEVYGASEFPFIFANALNVDCTVGICSSPKAIVKYDIDNDEPILNKKGFMQEVIKGETGLLLGEITEDILFTGYTNKNASEKKIFRNVFKKGDAWINTGDLLRDIGYKHVQFVDRLGDTFRWKGENVSTTEVEEVVSLVNNVSAATVYGIKIPNTDGRAGMAAIIPTCRVDGFDLDNLATILLTNLPSYAVPKFVRFKTEFDTTSTFKIKKTGLREEAFDLEKITDPMVVLLPGEKKYIPLTKKVYKEICEGEYRF